ncbi:MAG: hypothetical protein KKC51_12305 [Verrucomicrobia bacterium]|nr:hypothetical protein [Verrucomicrobiota bacterium]
MYYHAIILAWFGVLASLATGYAVLFLCENQPRLWLPLILLLALGFFSWLYLMLRLTAARRRLTGFLRRLLAGDYETGMRQRARFPDEVTGLADLANQLAERLQAYDALRAERVAFSYRALDLLHQQVAEPILLADIEKEVFRLNPAAKQFLDMEKDTVAFDALRAQSANQAFMDLFHEAAEKEKSGKNGVVPMQIMPGRDPLEVQVRIWPLKNKKEQVGLAVVMLAALPSSAAGEKTTG